MNTLACLCIFVLRLANAFSIKTFFQPDEYFQSLEPAHNLVYGYGYLTWEWQQALRSSIHPLIYALAYKTLNKVCPEAWAVTIAPKVVGALIATAADIYTYKFARRYWQSSDVAKCALGLSLLSSWNWYVSTRSFSNNLEMALTAAGLSYWPWHHYKLMPLLIACFFGFLSCVVRPTNAVLWVFLAAILVLRNARKLSRLASLFSSVSVVLLLTLAATSLVDRYFYGRWTFPVYNFIEFNVIKNLSVFYGSAPWHFYLSQGLPLILMGYTPMFVVALFQYRRSLLVGLCCFYVGAYSCIAHKEFRFLQPICPAMLVLSAPIFCQMRGSKFAKVAIPVLVCLHVSVAYVFTRINEIGEINIIELLRDDPAVESIGFLTPCHSTPWHSMLHRQDLVSKSWFLTCEPPLHMQSRNEIEIQTYRDQSDQFFDDPTLFLSNLPYDWPSHLVIFQPMENVILSELGDYKECHRIFNSYFHWDSRRRGDIIVYCKS